MYPGNFEKKDWDKSVLTHKTASEIYSAQPEATSEPPEHTSFWWGACYSK